jgi:hypothetical protein
MKAALAIILTLGVGGLSFAQAPTIVVQDAVLRLGMTEPEVTTELAKQTALFLSKDGSVANQQPSDTKSPDFEHFRLYASLKFTRGHLSYVEKYWRISDSPDNALVIMNALFGATSSVAGDGRVCTVRTWASAEPEQDYKETSIACELPNARRSIHAFIKTFHYQTELHSVQVNEVLESKTP